MENIYTEEIDYYEARETIFKSGAGIFWCGDGLLSDIISWKTGFDETHYSTLTSKDEDGTNRWKLIEADEGEGEGLFAGKVRRTYLSDKIKK